MKRVLHIATGGTIASTPAGAGGPVVASLGPAALLAGVEMPPGLAVDSVGFASAGSYALDCADLLGLARLVEAELPRHDGCVITHGTDTMEETAYSLELLLAPEKPVILTGAQRHAGAADSDGPGNLRNALRAAASDAMAPAGVCILFEEDIHAARHVRKVHTSRTDTFRSGDFGKLGSIDAGRVSIARLPRRTAPLGIPDRAAKVALIPAAIGTPPDLLHLLVGSDVEAVVVQGFGRGNFPRGWADACRRLIAAGTPVLVTSRCPEGAVMPVYGNDSGGTTMGEAGALFAGDLDSFKARLLLGFALARPCGDLAGIVSRYAGGD
ncbi:asparaginase [Haematobacter genomosp. 1]|uniref:asparaginase n=1 Tax=Haematobacter genomosp. 1 TaxID=366618 RepID=UPI0015C58ADE|nr:asparaginase [Haematobacter genomosp. 1]